MSETDGRYSPPIPQSVAVSFDKGQWTHLTISALRQLWGLNYSTKRIGERLGFSKNAIVGKAHRLDLPERPSPFLIGGLGGWITDERKELLRDLWPSQTSTDRIMEILASAPGPALPSQHTVSAYANNHLHLRRQARPTVTLAPLTSELAEPPVVSRLTPKTPASPFESRIAAKVRSQIGLHDYRAKNDYVPGVKTEPVPIEKIRAVMPVSTVRIPECCWPINDSYPWRFCDAPASSGRSYCPEHMKLAYVHRRPAVQDAAD